MSALPHFPNHMATELRNALRQNLDVVFRFATDDLRDDAANSVYQDTLGNYELSLAFSRVFQLHAQRATFNEIGEAFNDWAHKAEMHFAETLTDAVADGSRIIFERRP